MHQHQTVLPGPSCAAIPLKPLFHNPVSACSSARASHQPRGGTPQITAGIYARQAFSDFPRALGLRERSRSTFCPRVTGVPTFDSAGVFPPVPRPRSPHSPAQARGAAGLARAHGSALGLRMPTNRPGGAQGGRDPHGLRSGGLGVLAVLSLDEEPAPAFAEAWRQARASFDLYIEPRQAGGRTSRASGWPERSGQSGEPMWGRPDVARDRACGSSRSPIKRDARRIRVFLREFRRKVIGVLAFTSARSAGPTRT